MNRTLLSIVALGVAITAAPAFAQSSTSQEVAALRAEIARLNARLDALEAAEAEGPAPRDWRRIPMAGQATGVLAEGNRGAPLAAPPDAPLHPSGITLNFSAGSEDGRVSLSAAQDWMVSQVEGGRGWGEARQATVEISAPVNKDGDFSEVATLDGFANAFEFKLGAAVFRRSVMTVPTSEAATRIIARAHAACETREGAKPGATPASVRQTCWNVVEGDNFIRTYLTEADVINFHQELFGPAQALGVEARVGYDQRKFLDAATAVEHKDEFTPWGVKVFYSWLPADGLSSWTGAVEYQEAWEDQDKGVLCPTGPGAVLACLSGAVGAPEREDKLLTSLEWRRMFNRNDESFLPGFAVSARLTWDQVSDEYGLDVPIYLVRGDKGLTGGIRLGYTSEKDDTTIGFFVGAPFGLR